MNGAQIPDEIVATLNIAGLAVSWDRNTLTWCIIVKDSDHVLLHVFSDINTAEQWRDMIQIALEKL